jgi:O-methyltransferase involved in polyketide biosynthesis
VPVAFEANESWLERLVRASVEPRKPTGVASTGVAMCLTKETVAAMLREVATLAPGSTFAMSFMLPLELAEPEERPAIEAAARGARGAGTPFISSFSPPEILALAREAGFKDVKHVSAAQPSSGEELLVATT